MRHLLFAAALFAGSSARADILLQRVGDATFQCCAFGQAIALTWTQSTAWENVSIDLELYHNDAPGVVRTGVAYLLNSLGPGTTAANEIDEAILASTTPGSQTVTAFSGLNLGAGTYHLVYRDAMNSAYGDGLLALFGGAPAIEAGPGVTLDATRLEDIEAGYPPASVYSNYSNTLLFRISGTPVLNPVTPVPEPNLVAGIGVALTAIGWMRRRQRP